MDTNDSHNSNDSHGNHGKEGQFKCENLLNFSGLAGGVGSWSVNHKTSHHPTTGK